MVLLPDSPRYHFSRSSASGRSEADNVLPYGKHHLTVCLLQNTSKRAETPLQASLLGAAPTPPFTSLFIHAGTALQAPAPCPGGLPTTRTLPPAPRMHQGRARASQLCRQTLRWQQTLPRWMETPAAASPICSLAHLVPLRSTAVQLLLEKEPGSAPGANVSADIYFPLKCIGVFLNLFTTALPGLFPL